MATEIKTIKPCLGLIFIVSLPMKMGLKLGMLIKLEAPELIQIKILVRSRSSLEL